MYYIGKINTELYECVCKNIASDELIITEKQIQHIIERHGNDFDLIKPFLLNAVNDPDYILKDENHLNTGLILKEIKSKYRRLQIVLRLQSFDENNGLKNSVISAWIISENRWNNYLKNKNILYKKE